ncbi:MFS transporter [Sulfitobacter sp. S190]|uniref:MFS transporter n=1 Tax=Sulfitobacter sp. S190 TaxID=2867022 RepID=UPI0021A65727|nr:MFS transporter [Sulfitobacter sp. S190]UWR21466.1 MFS transporter [Sulfitobacter sp. S190]
MTQAETNRVLILVLSACNFVIGIGAFVIVGILQPLGADLERSPAQAGQLMTVYAVGYAILSPILVSVTGQIGRRRILAISFGIFTLAAVLSALAPNYLTLSVARVVAAAGAGIFTPIAAAVAATLSPEAQRARVLAAVFFGLTLAQVVGVPAGSWIAYTFGWRWALWLVAGLGVPCIWLIWTRVPAGLRFQPVSMADLGDVLCQGRMMLAIMFTGTFLGAIYVLYTYISPLLSQTMGYGGNGITLILIVFGLGAVGGNIMGGFLADKLGWHKTLTVLCVAQMLIMPMFSLLPVATGMVVLLAFLWSLCGWSFMAGQQLRLINLAGPRAPVVLALNAAAIYIGAALGSGLGGLIIARFGIEATGLAAGLVSLGALIHLTLSARLSPRPATGS